MLSRQDIIDCNDIETEVVKVPKWGGEVTVHGLSLEEKDDWNNSIMIDGEATMKGSSAKLCILCMKDEDGNALFTMDDVPMLQAKSSIAMDVVFQAAQRLSGIGQEELEETVKNSERITISDSD